MRMSSGLAEPLPGGWYRSGHLPAAVLRPGSFPLFSVLPSRRPCRERCGLLPAAGECSLPLALRGAPAEGILASPRRLRCSPHGNRGLVARGSRRCEAMSSRRSACPGLGLPQRGPLSALDRNGSVLFLLLNNGLVGIFFFFFYFPSPHPAVLRAAVGTAAAPWRFSSRSSPRPGRSRCLSRPSVCLSFPAR